MDWSPYFHDAKLPSCVISVKCRSRTAPLISKLAIIGMHSACPKIVLSNDYKEKNYAIALLYYSCCLLFYTICVFKCGQSLHLFHAVNRHKLHPYAAAKYMRPFPG